MPLFSYKDLKEFYCDFKNDKVMLKIFRILGFLAIAIIVITGLGAWWRGFKDKPVNYCWGFYVSNPKDTIRIIRTDTIYRDTSYNKSGKFKQNIYKDDATHVESYNQKGGQTARDIINNPK